MIDKSIPAWIKASSDRLAAKNECYQVLRVMGYRDLSGHNADIGIWAKPMGYSLLAFEFGTAEWSQRFRAADSGKTLIWTSVKFDGETSQRHESLQWLASCEAYHYHYISQGQPWDFATDDDRVAMLTEAFS